MEAWVLVSGAGSGIGLATSTLLAEAGFGVLLLGRDEQKLATARAQCLDPARHKLIQADVRDPDSIRAGLRDSGLTSLHAVIANAGIGGENHYGPGDRWHEILATNLTGVYNLVNEALPYLNADREAHSYRHVLVVSSILARLGVPDYSAYCAAKAGLLGLVRSWAAGFARNQILVNAVCPGWVDTDMARQGLQAFADSTKTTFEQALRTHMSQVPLRKMSQPDEVGKLIRFLVDGSTTSFTGQAFDINNGALMP